MVLEFVARFIIYNVLGELVVDTREPENGKPNERRVGAIKRLLEQTRWAVRPETCADSARKCQVNDPAAPIQFALHGT